MPTHAGGGGTKGHDHGIYPSTEEWLKTQNPLSDYILTSYMYDLWGRKFHYAAVMENGKIVNYKLESYGKDVKSHYDNILCPIDTEKHQFSGENPIQITFPQHDETIGINIKKDVSKQNVVLQAAGYSVDFRDYQFNHYEDPFSIENCISYLEDSSDISGISVMANLLPFAVLLSKEIKIRYPDKKIVLGGVGAKSVESQILTRFPEIDVIAYGECEVSGPIILNHLIQGKNLADCPNIFYRENGKIDCLGP